MKAKNVLAASALLEQGLSDILSLQTERDKIRSAGLLNQQKLTSEALGTQYKAAQQFYNTLMASDDKSSAEFKVFADRAWSNLKEIENTYNKFHGIATLPQVSAMKIFQHEISLLPEGMTSWNDSLLEAMKRKPSYADVPEDVWQGVEVIWKASQPKAKAADKTAAGDFLGAEKEVLDFFQGTEGRGILGMPFIKIPSPSLEGIKKFEEGGKTEYTPPSFFDMFNFGRSLKARRKNKPASEKAKMRHKRKMARQKARQERKMFKIINK